MNKKNIIILICTLLSGIVIGSLMVGVVTYTSFANSDENPDISNCYNNVLASPPLPQTLTFAGEPVPINNYWVREALDRELTAVCYQHSTTLLGLKRSGRWFPTIDKIFKEEGVPEDFKYLCIAESNMSNAISPAKAVGFWQFIEGTARLYKLEVRDEVDERYHIEKATHAACQYLMGSKERLGSWSLAAAAYNMGEAGVKNSLKAQSVNSYWDLYLNPETARYVYRILAYKLLFENPHIYGVQVSQKDKYKPFEYEEVEVTTSIPDLYQFCQEHNITYRQLKELNPWLRSTKLTVNNKSYFIKIPVNKK
ncbi:MAG: lytic transglycosylase domain-containing protein [Bacteroidales bacterium]|nr:lytic transglycosylase domain-containing protein [Bacteroidales bacterium]